MKIMNSLSQYLELYRLNAPAIDANSVAPLNRYRGEAFEMLSKMRLPHKGEEDYEITSVDEIFADDLGVNLQRVPIGADVMQSFKCEVPNMSTLLVVVVNDQVHLSSTLAAQRLEGLQIMSLKEAAKQYPEMVEKYYGTLAPLTNPTVALNTLLAQDGVWIHVDEGVKLDRPIQIVNIFNAPASLLSPRRIVVALESDAQLKVLVCDHTQDNAHAYVSSEVVEVFQAEGSHLHYHCIEESSSNTQRHSDVYASLDKGAQFEGGNITLTCGTTRTNYSIDLKAQQAACHLAGMAIGSNEQTIDNNVVVRHLAPRCESRQLFKYVLSDNARGAFGGRILVTPGAKFTDASQTNRNLIDGNGARMFGKPQLEIYNDDVKCSHGSSTGQLSDEALFYMRTRGIPQAEARNMLMQAFMADVIDSISMSELRDRLRHLVERRFNGSLSGASCGECSKTSCKS